MSAIFCADLIKEVAVASGTGNFTLQGAATGFDAYGDRIPSGSLVPYTARQGTIWESGIGTLISATELSRDYPKSSSASSGQINNQNPGTPTKASFDAGASITIYCSLISDLLLLKDSSGGLVDGSPFRLTVFLASIASMKAQDGLSNGETVLVAGAGTLGGLFTFDSADATAPDNVDTFRSDNYATGLWKRVRPDIQGDFNGGIVVDASASAGGTEKIYSAKKASNANNWFGRRADASTSALIHSARLNQASEVDFWSLFSLGTNADRIALHKPFVLPTKANAQGIKDKSIYYDSTDVEITTSVADAADNTTAADRMVIPRVKGTYLLGTYELISDLRAIDAAKYAKANQRAHVLGSSDGGDVPSFFVEWFPSSSATHDGVNTFRPTVGAAASGNGRWIRVAAAIDLTFTSGDATPTVANGGWFITAGTTAITDFDDAFEGQEITVYRGASDIVITHDATKIALAGRANRTLTLDFPAVTLKSVGGVWREIAGTTLYGSEGSQRVGHKPSDASASSSFATSFQIMNQVPSLLSWLPGGVISADRSVNLAAFNAFLVDLAARGRAEGKLPPGEIPINGAITWSQTGLALRGGGGRTTLITSNALTTNMLNLTGDGNILEGVGFYRPGASAGQNIYVDGADNCRLNHIEMDGGFDGIKITNCGVMQADTWQIYNMANTNLWLLGGDGVNGVQGFNLVNADLTNSSASDGANGMLRMEGFVSAARLMNVEVLGGYRSLYAYSASLSEVSSPSYCHMTQCFFDGGARDNVIEKTLECEFVACEFSGGRTGGGYDNLTLKANKGLKFIGGKSSNAGNHGVTHISTNISVEFTNFDVINNGYTSSTGRGYSFEDNSTGFKVIGGRTGNGFAASGPGQNFGVITGSACEGVIMGVTFVGNNTLPVINSSTSAKMIYIANPGAEAYDRFPIGGGTPMTAVLTASATYDPPSMPTLTGATTYVTVTGARAGDRVLATHSSNTSGQLLVTAMVNADDTVCVTLFNITNATVDLASGTLKVSVWKTA